MSREAQLIVKNWYQQNHSVVSGEMTLDIPLIQHMIGLNKKVLNLGCYRGELEQVLGPRAGAWLGVDFVEELVEHCKALNIRGNVHFQVANITKMIFFGDEMWDVILDMSTGDHLELEDFKLMLKEVYRLLIPGGHFAVAYYNFEVAKGVRAGFENYGYYRKDTPAEMKAMLEDTGFTVLRMSGGIRAHAIARKE